MRYEEARQIITEAIEQIGEESKKKPKGKRLSARAKAAPDQPSFDQAKKSAQSGIDAWRARNPINRDSGLREPVPYVGYPGPMYM